MRSAAPVPDKPLSPRRFRLIAAGLLAVCLLVALATWAYTKDYLIGDATERSMAVLDFHAESAEGALDKYRVLPALIARRADVRAMFLRADASDPDGAVTQVWWARASGELLAAQAALTGAHAISFSTAEGNVFATSRPELRGLSVGAVIADEPHFKAALGGRLGRQTMVTADDTRLYVFSAPVRSRGDVAGVISVAVDLERIERPWTFVADTLLAHDAEGLVVMSNRVGLRLRSLAEGPAQRHRPDAPVLRIAAGPDGPAEIDDEELSGRYILVRHAMPIFDWTMIDLVELAPLHRRAELAAGFAGAAAALIAIAMMALLQRRRAIAAKLRNERANALRLERRVEARTRDLRQARNELLQATKLAALGQMSASLAHEYNQPLAAMLSNADNAETLIRRGTPEQALDNLDRLRGLVDRLGETSRALKTFARKPGTKLRPVDLRAAADASMSVLQPKRRAAGVEVRVRGNGVTALAGSVRMEQVLVNLIGNAIDAARERHADGGGEVAVDVGEENGQAVITVVDNGAGVALSPKEAVFDPFVTTKAHGEGLGLGLSIAYNIVKDFAGDIAVDSTMGGGAVFRVRLPLANGEETDDADNDADRPAG